METWGDATPAALNGGLNLPYLGMETAPAGVIAPRSTCLNLPYLGMETDELADKIGVAMNSIFLI